MILLRGEPVAESMFTEIRAMTDRFKRDFRPHAVLDIICNDQSQPYYKGLVKDAAKCGVKVVGNTRPVEYWTVDGVISLTDKHPAPYSLNVDGGTMTPCTAEAVITMLEYYDIPIEGRDVCIIGRSERVGKPLVDLFLGKDATVTICHSKTANLAKHVDNADIIVSCVGGAQLDDICQVGKDATLIDVGGDFLNVTDCYAKAPFIGGVGPVTRAVCLKHVCIKKESRK